LSALFKEEDLILCFGFYLTYESDDDNNNYSFNIDDVRHY